MPEYTRDEVKDMFISHVKYLINYWDKVKQDIDEPEYTTKYKLEGLAHSILATLDGCNMSLPSFIVAPSPHPEDKQYHIDNDGEEARWFPENHDVDINCDIAGGLHELLHK